MLYDHVTFEVVFPFGPVAAMRANKFLDGMAFESNVTVEQKLSGIASTALGAFEWLVTTCAYREEAIVKEG